MKLSRITGKVRDLFYVSQLDNLGGKALYPTTKSGSDVKRICLYPSVDKALLATGLNLEGLTLHVYSPVNLRIESLIKPGVSQQASSILTDEYWYLAPITLKKIASIKVGTKKLPGLSYADGPRGTKKTLFMWDWEEILKPWEKVGKLFLG